MTEAIPPTTPSPRASGISRRKLLGTAAAGAAGAAALSLLPPSVHRAMAAPMRAGGLDAIEHVILLMQENRSFDHYYGPLRGVRGFGDQAPMRLRTGKSAFHQPKPTGGEVLPFSVRTAAEAAGRPDSDIQYLGDLNHEWNGSTKAWAQGWWDEWIAAKTPPTMTHYERPDIPLQYELADTFTVLDAYHCSLFGGTNPNRNYFVSGMTGYEPGTTQRAVTNAAYSYDHPGYEWTCYPERLESAGVSWQVYQEWDNFTDNAIEYFLPFKKIGHKLLAGIEGGKYRTTEEFYYALFDMNSQQREKALGQLAEAREQLSAEERSLFDRGMARSEPDTMLARVKADIAAGTLPAVSWLVPTAALSEHPGASTPVGSANLIYDLLDIVASDPDTWSKTAILINFDENDGFFDHVPSPVAPRPASGEDDDWYQGKAIGLGVRVPMVIVSPWTIGGFVNSEVADHTSVLRFLERWTGVREPNISAWRRTACGDLTSAFDFTRAGQPPVLDEPGAVPSPISRWHPAPPSTQAVPPQEPGRRPARALPYRPSVASALTGPTTLQLTLANGGSRAAHFAVYSYAAGGPVNPEHRDVRGQRVETLTVAGSYDVAVQGPNRFWHELRGSATGAAAKVIVGTASRVGRLGLEITLANKGSRQVVLVLKPLRYSGSVRTLLLKPGGETTVTWPTDKGWYDVEVTARDDASFRRRMTGRVENGSAGVSAQDPGRRRRW